MTVTEKSEPAGIEVACPSCDTRYKISADKLARGSGSFKCSSCGKVFPLRTRKENDGQSAWTVKLVSSEEEMPVTSMDTLKRWIIEGKVGPDDLLARAGGSYKPLGDIQRFRAFFRVVEQKNERDKSSPAIRIPGIGARATDARDESDEAPTGKESLPEDGSDKPEDDGATGSEAASDNRPDHSSRPIQKGPPPNEESGGLNVFAIIVTLVVIAVVVFFLAK
jgi:predicted Zn finger-like uncharacterized protein